MKLKVDVKLNEFQSTPPVRGATLPYAPRICASDDFNPRPPCGGRLSRLRYLAECLKFQSTPPVRGATLSKGYHSS